MRSNGPGITIGIESAIEGGSLTLFREADEIDAVIGEKGISRAENILPNLDRLLEQHGLNRRLIDKVVVSTGPGSFTGIKIGISTAMGLADGLGCSAFSMSGLEAMTFATETDGGTLTAVPIGRDFVATQNFQKSAGMAQPLSSPKLLTKLHFIEEVTNLQGIAVLYSDLIQELKGMKAANVLSVGPNIASLVVRGHLQGGTGKEMIPLFIDRKPLAVTG